MDANATYQLYNYLKQQAGTDLKANLKDILDKEHEKDMQAWKAREQQEAQRLKSQQDLAEYTKQQKEKRRGGK